MGLPTLLKKGVLIPMMGEKKETLDNFIGIDYIISWFSKRFTSTDLSINDKIIVMESATGSGKSTVLPTELFLRLYEHILGNIIVTQPRVVTTIEIPNTIVNIPVYKDKLILGKNIGYATKEHIKKPITKGILFCTIGVLLQYLKNIEPKEFCKKFKVIMLDEAHDRSINLDLIFYYLKILLTKVSIAEYPFVIITSATMDIDKYTSYFNTKTIFKVIGTSYPIKDNFNKYDNSNIIDSAVNTIISIHENNKNDKLDENDIVVFIPSNSFTKKIKERIDIENNKLKSGDKILALGLDSSGFKTSSIDYQNIFTPLNNIKGGYKRKVIIGTNAIETGITLETIKYCIDLGLVNQLEYNPNLKLNILSIKPVTKAMSMQRRGRVGRIRDGIFYGLYTNELYNELQEIQYPEILINNVDIPILNILSANDKSTNDIINNLDMLDKIQPIAINTSINTLYQTGMLDKNGDINEIGKLSNKIRMISIENIRLILSGFYYKCNIMDLVTIVSFIELGKQKITLNKFKSFQHDFVARNEKEKKADAYNYNKLKSRLFISCEFIDFLLFFYKFKEVMAKNKSNIKKTIAFCDDNKINFYGMMELIEFRDEIIKDLLFNCNIYSSYKNDINIYDIMKKIKNDNHIYEFIQEIVKIKNCIYRGYIMNIATYNSEYDSYISNYSKQKLNIDSYLVKNMPNIQNGEKFKELKPKYILYDKIIVKKNFNGKFILNVENISVMSGFVNII